VQKSLTMRLLEGVVLLFCQASYAEYFLFELGKMSVERG
jgi:hypothetical protein